jgi:hypothetical protein
MGKKAKEHRKRVEKRNAKLKQQKSGMQKAFDMILQQQLEKLKEGEISAKLGEQEINMEIVEDRVVDNAFSFIPNPEESAKISKVFEDQTQTEEPQTEE